jgi:hypothetical protein
MNSYPLSPTPTLWYIFLLTTSLLLLAPLTLQGQENCNNTKPPVVFVHGFLASGDTWATQIQRFASNGHCQDRYFAFDWNSLDATGNTSVLLDAFIDAVLLATDAEQVHLVGHSAGGGQGYAYLSDVTRAAKVISYAHIGSSSESSPAGPNGSVPTINIWSTADAVVAGADIPGAENVQFDNLDHYQVATSAATFAAIYEFFYGSAPATTSILPTSTVTISGRCSSLGDNMPTVGVNIEVFAVDEQGNPTGEPLGTFDIGADGFWGPIDVEPTTYYLFKISSEAPGFRKIIYYYEPFIRDNPVVYLRTFPNPFSLAGFLLSGIPNSDDQSAISIFTSTQAVIHGRDQLSMDAYELSGPDLAAAEASMIALFCYDDGSDGVGNAEPIGVFTFTSFIQGADIPINPEPAQTWTITFNGASMPVRNWRSQSDGVVIAVFNEQETITSIEPVVRTGPGLEIWPNPAKHQTQLHLADVSLNGNQIKVIDMLGRQVSVSSTSLSNGDLRLDTRQMPSGTYWVIIQTVKGAISAPLLIHR